MILLTDSAAAQIKLLLEGKPEQGLRISISRGGCAGLQYDMKLGNAVPGDEIVSHEGATVIVVGDSIAFLRDSTVDYSDALEGAGFRLINPNAVRSCGCGTSFEPAGN